MQNVLNISIHIQLMHSTELNVRGQVLDLTSPVNVQPYGHQSNSNICWAAVWHMCEPRNMLGQTALESRWPVPSGLWVFPMLSGCSYKHMWKMHWDVVTADGDVITYGSISPQLPFNRGYQYLFVHLTIRWESEVNSFYWHIKSQCPQCCVMFDLWDIIFWGHSHKLTNNIN